jgi:tRNA(adenine34) deaminase
VSADDDTREDTAKGDTAEGDTAEGDTAEGDTAEGGTAEGDTAEGDTAKGGTSTDVNATGAAATADDLRFMAEAIAQARLAAARGEVPVGAVLVHEGRVIARGSNLREAAQDPSAHAELIAVRAAAARLGTWRLSGVTVYVTLEPCPMCAGLLVNARVDRVVYGATDPKAGATETLYGIGSDLRLNHRFALTSGVRRDECASLLSEFFQRIREARRVSKG